ncbi:MAG: nuclear transport factor 2 family protein [Alphaproteobacteria bacterium]|nr:nuclear transport factor 2 family protein [Alphaproteobacteria bacterium]
MKSSLLMASVVAAAAAIPSLAAAASTDETAIRALESRFAQAVNAKDIDGIMKTYSPDIFVFDVVPPRQYVGAAAYRKDWQGFVGSYKGPIKFTLSDLAISVEGNLGYGHSVQRIVGTDQKGVASDMTVRVTDVYRKTNGQWLIVQEHVSVPVDLETMKPDVHSRP